MKLKKINKFFNTYQPIIQTGGIILVLLGLIIAIWQIVIARREFELSKEQAFKESQPKWRVEIEWDKDNALIDELLFSALNSDYNLQKIKVTITDLSEPIYFEKYTNKVSTIFLKNALQKIIAKYYREDSTSYCILCDFDESYPIAVTYYYEQLGNKKDTTILYNYHFKIYSFNNSYKIKSKGIEFQKYISSEQKLITKELIRFNINNSFLSNIPEAIYQIKSEIALKDSVFKPLIEYVTINFMLTEHIIVLISEDKKSNPVELRMLYPTFTRKDSILKVRNKIVDRINLNIEKDKYDDQLVKHLNRIDSFNTKFNSFKGSWHNIDSLLSKKVVRLNEKQVEEWKKLNQQLLQLVNKNISI